MSTHLKRYTVLTTHLYLNPCLLTELSTMFQNSGPQMVLAYSVPHPTHTKF